MRSSLFYCLIIVLCGLWWAWIIWLVNKHIIDTSQPYIYSDIWQLTWLQDIQVALILWSKVKRDDLSQILEDRVKVAFKLYDTDKVYKLLVSGDNGSQYYNEVGAIAKYLKKKWVYTGDVFLDYAGFDTYDSIYRAKYIFQVKSMIIVTQAFHLPRAIYIARSLGIEAYGLEADLHQYQWINRNIWREYGARMKAYRDILIGSSPRFGWKVIPLTGPSNMI